ncbi:molybdenum cofactor guanylyltransferase [Halorientalis brevis]|uniref:Probable molybdenum cofactor guanylyltransferase n=1 Tax=Halorientalis brevis TaxID=1126241 RepID=A0ABD6CHW9_9EURY|nr:molybdenum cofactor guanylyltransferase [Halorientalis brevis]
MTMETVTGVVLAGGDSDRFGDENKALATYDGETLIERVVASVTAVTDQPPLVAVRDRDQRTTLQRPLSTGHVEFVTDADGFQGPIAGFAAAASDASRPWLFACGCDMPLLSATAISWLGAFREPDVDAVVVQTDGGREPLHAFYRRSTVRRALSSLPTRAGLQALLGELEAVRTVRASQAPEAVAITDSLTNVNTRRELSTISD